MKTPATYEGNCWLVGRESFWARRLTPNQRASQHSPERGRARTTRDPRRAPPLDQGTLGSPTGEVRGVSPRVRELPDRAPRSVIRGIPDISFSVPAPGHWRAISRGRRRRAASRGRTHHVRAFRRSSRLARDPRRSAFALPPSPARTPLTTLVFPHSQAAPSGAALLEDDKRQAEDLVLLRPRCGQLYYGQGGHPMKPHRVRT